MQVPIKPMTVPALLLANSSMSSDWLPCSTLRYKRDSQGGPPLTNIEINSAGGALVIA